MPSDESQTPAATPRPIIQVRVEAAILVIRGQRVLLDSDIASLYGVETRALVQAVKRNRARFPEDFMFRLTIDEARRSRSQRVILNGQPSAISALSPSGRHSSGRGSNIKHLPYAFTEQGVAMLASVLRSPQAVRVNIEIVRTFVRLRLMLQTNPNLAAKLEVLERKRSLTSGRATKWRRTAAAPSPRPSPRFAGRGGRARGARGQTKKKRPPRFPAGGR